MERKSPTMGAAHLLQVACWGRCRHKSSELIDLQKVTFVTIQRTECHQQAIVPAGVFHTREVVLKLQVQVLRESSATQHQSCNQVRPL
jgi:hypothetical protein